jgi:ABC-type spermidine/putrescine transport system permease subunit II
VVGDPSGWGIVAVYAWKEIPYVAFCTVTIMMHVSGTLGEAAAMSGASPARSFFSVTLPLCAPAAVQAFVVVAAFSFGSYEVVYLLGPTYPKTLPVLAYMEFQDPDLVNRCYAMALNGITTGVVRAHGGGVLHRRARCSAGRRVLVARRKGRGASRAAACVLVAVQLAIVVVTLGVMAVWSFADAWPWPQLAPQAWSLRGYAIVFSGSSDGWPSLALSVGIGAASSLVATVAGAMGARAVVLPRMAGEGRLPPRHDAALPHSGHRVRDGRAGGLHPHGAGPHRAGRGACACDRGAALRVGPHDRRGARPGDPARRRGPPARRGTGRDPFQVSIPSLAPGLLSALSMGFIISCSQYFLTLLVGGGKVRTFALAMFPYVAGGDRTIAAAYGVIFIGGSRSRCSASSACCCAGFPGTRTMRCSMNRNER